MDQRAQSNVAAGLNTSPNMGRGKVGGGGGSGGGGPIFLGVLVLVVTALVGMVVYISKGTGTPSGPTGLASTSAATKEKIDGYIAAARNVAGSDPGKAEAILREAIASYSDNQSLYLAHAESLMVLRRVEEAYRAYEKAIAIGPRDARMDFMAGTVASMAGKPDRAIEHYSAARQADPANWEVPLYLAQVQLKLNQITEAKTNLLTAAKLQPEKAIVWGMLGELYLREGSPAVALEQVAKARTIEPASIQWRLVEARALKRLDRADEALTLLIGLSDQQKFDPPVLQLMGECYGLLNAPTEAADIYSRASDADAGNGQLAFDAAVWLERAGRTSDAIKYAQRAAMTGTPNADKLHQRLSEAK